MATFREMKHEARGQLHATLAEPVYYFADPEAEPEVVTARLHLSFRALGFLSGGGHQGFGRFEEITPKAVFLVNEIRPAQNALIVTKYNGLLLVENVQPDDGFTIQATVSSATRGNTIRYGTKRWGWQPDTLWCGMPEPVLAP